jgi:hypothetical protein
VYARGLRGPEPQLWYSAPKSGSVFTSYLIPPEEAALDFEKLKRLYPPPRQTED